MAACMTKGGAIRGLMPCTIIANACRTVGQWNCDYFDDIKSLEGFGAANKEGLAELVWAFFGYWAWRHDYNNSVISVRTGGFLTKSHKEWTRRVGNERHLVCIEVASCMENDGMHAPMSSVLLHGDHLHACTHEFKPLA